MNEEAVQAQNIFLYDRKKLEMTGISDVSAFSDTSVEMSYSGGMIAVVVGTVFTCMPEP